MFAVTGSAGVVLHAVWLLIQNGVSSRFSFQRISIFESGSLLLSLFLYSLAGSVNHGDPSLVSFLSQALRLREDCALFDYEFVTKKLEILWV